MGDVRGRLVVWALQDLETFLRLFGGSLWDIFWASFFEQQEEEEEENEAILIGRIKKK